MAFTIHHGDCRKVMATLDADSVDAVVCDPPYGLSFMGKGWDHGVPGEEFWTEALRVAKPGAHLLAFGGTRTYHRLACAIEDAGWEIRDCVMWVYGSGFPKSHDVSKAIDKAAGAERTMRINERWAERYPNGPGGNLNSGSDDQQYGQLNRVSGNPLLTSDPVTPAAQQWAGWGTALKPAWEPIIVARKPLVGTVAENVLTHGTGGINVDGCRVGTDGGTAKGNPPKDESNGIYGHGINGACDILDIGKGRWPANLIHDGSEEVESLTGSAARFFYCAKASKADRDEGCEGLPQTIKQSVAHGDKRHGTLPYTNEPREMNPRPRGNHHPTVKPADLMRYLCRLVTPPGGVVLDPFTGSGSTGKGAVLEGFRFIGIEREAEYVEIAKARIAAVSGGGTLF
jgi:DNA modification methylase